MEVESFFLSLAAHLLEWELRCPKVSFCQVNKIDAQGAEVLKYEDYVRRKQKQEGFDKLGENKGTKGLT